MKFKHHIIFVILILCFKNCVNEAVLEENSFKLQHNNTNKTQRDLSLNVTQLIAACGYCGEEYQVITADGYILSLQRIPNKGPPVFLMHGLLNSAEDFLTLGPEKSLACLLGNAGYDVWLGNARGNKYSRNHVQLSPEDRVFWNFTFHEMGIYDLPAMIDYALDKSNQSQLTYIGHSQGTTAFYVMASLLPEHGSKILQMISMASVAWLTHVKTPVLRTFIPLRYLEYQVSNALGLYEFLPYDAFWRFITTQFCPSTKFTMYFCASFLFSVYGFDYKQLNYTQFPTQIGHIPAGVSIKTLLHFGQLVASGKFQQFDNTPKKKNLEAYGSIAPPLYPVHNIFVPVAIIYSDNDLISVLEDVQVLIKNLPNVTDVYRVPFKDFNHMDYLWAKDAKELLYTKVLLLINKASK